MLVRCLRLDKMSSCVLPQPCRDSREDAGSAFRGTAMCLCSRKREEYLFEKYRNLDVTVVRRTQTIFQPVEARPI
jgi:hypothetical protein